MQPGQGSAILRCQQHVATMAEIEENDYNLNIPRYVDTFEKEEEIDIPAVQEEIKQIEADKQEAISKLNGMLKELGLQEV